MRILLVFIILLNLLYAGWEYLNPVANSNLMPPLADNLKTLELLHEPPGETMVSETDKLSVNNATTDEEFEQDKGSAGDNEVVEPVVAKVSCYTLGPFKDKNIMQQLRETIAEYVTDLSVRKRQEAEKHRYWVYVPALPDRKQAKLLAKQLRQKGLNDFYIVLSGKAKNSISLGHFREPKHANLRMKRVIDLGFKAEIEVIYRDYDIYWLDYKVDEVSGDPGFSVDEYISEGVSQLARDC
ncbi:MAG: SPOR domain-containing protein [Gammaproteobacteria bacterium]|nr:SPOR domain-containing protein [Gammaproteobacteria bacterium]